MIELFTYMVKFGVHNIKDDRLIRLQMPLFLSLIKVGSVLAFIAFNGQFMQERKPRLYGLSFEIMDQIEGFKNLDQRHEMLNRVFFDKNGVPHVRAAPEF
mmetsp:Transcript_39603/g.60597  ORF Transcript_39603/g.60597 Transcript_39603/m.60597 type:complete len:100 (+) Transcript_39603:1261-1560(+)